MNKKIALFSGLSASVLAVCIVIFTVYRNFAFGGLVELTLNSLQNAAFPILGIMAGTVIIMRFILPCTFNRCSKETETSIIYRYTDFAAWIFLALCISALIASPLAETADYIGLAALCGVFSVVFALVPAVPALCRQAEMFSSPIVAFGFVLSVIPAVGIYSAISGTVFSVTALREEKISKNQGTAFIALGVFSMLIAAVSTFCFVYLLLIK